MSTAEEMWKAVQDDATLKSTLFILDAEDQLSSMKLGDNKDPKNSPHRTKTTLSTHDTTERQPDKDGVNYF